MTKMPRQRQVIEDEGDVQEITPFKPQHRAVDMLVAKYQTVQNIKPYKPLNRTKQTIKPLSWP